MLSRFRNLLYTGLLTVVLGTIIGGSLDCPPVEDRLRQETYNVGVVYSGQFSDYRMDAGIQLYKEGVIENLMIVGGEHGIRNMVNRALSACIGLRQESAPRGLILPPRYSQNTEDDVRVAHEIINENNWSSVLHITDDNHKDRVAYLNRVNGGSDDDDYFASDVPYNSWQQYLYSLRENLACAANRFDFHLPTWLKQILPI